MQLDTSRSEGRVGGPQPHCIPMHIAKKKKKRKHSDYGQDKPAADSSPDPLCCEADEVFFPLSLRQ